MTNPKRRNKRRKKAPYLTDEAKAEIADMLSELGYTIFRPSWLLEPERYQLWLRGLTDPVARAAFLKRNITDPRPQGGGSAGRSE